MTISITETTRPSDGKQFVQTTEMLSKFTRGLRTPALDKVALYIYIVVLRKPHCGKPAVFGPSGRANLLRTRSHEGAANRQNTRTQGWEVSR